MRKTSLALVAFAFLPSLIYAQQASNQRTSKPSIEVAGVKLELGMSRAEVAERFVGTQITKVNDDFWSIGSIGTVQFKNNRLVYADRSWINEDTNVPLSADDIAEAIFKAVASLNRQGFSVCVISHDIPDAGQKGYTPEGREIDIPSRAERVWIDCGEKAVRILTLSNHDASSKSIEVTEVLGDWSPQK